MCLHLLSESVTPDASVGFTATVIIAGLGVVLATLIILIIVFNIFGKIVSKTQGADMKRNKKKSNTLPPQLNIVNTPPPAPEKPAAPAAQGISGEVVAAISAAVYMMEGDGAVVTSIAPAAAAARKQAPNPITRRNPWAFAAISENTRPF